jgi:SAM-dependent methyltransferase
MASALHRQLTFLARSAYDETIMDLGITNKISVTRRKTCRLCEGGRLELVVPLAPTPVAEKYVTREELDQETPVYPLDLHLCLDCGHVQLLDVVDPEFLFDDYTYESGSTKQIVQHFDKTVEAACARYHPAPNSLVVDVGSNDGSLLRCFQKRGLRVLGIDPASEIAKKATQSGIPTIAQFLNLDLARRLKKEHGPAAVVCAFNVFAHADNLGGMADAIREMLAPGGVFIFEVSYLLDILDHMLLGTIFHEHVSYHSVKPLASFLRRHGMELVDIQRVGIQGGSIIGTAQLAGGGLAAGPMVGELLELERARGLDRAETLKEFAAQLGQVKEELGGLMADLKKQGKSVWGYGAARSGTTLIAQMNLGKVISHIVDDSPAKQNKFSPGDHIPILPSKALAEQKPDYAFILAWVHARQIIENNRGYLQQGGRFIVCFPKIQVVSAETPHLR